MGLPSIKELFKGGTEGLIKGVTDGAANIISKFKADPTKIAEFEKDLETLRINTSIKAEELANQAEEIHNKTLEIQIKEMESARSREIQIATSDKAPLLNKIITPLLALIIVIATLVIWALILFRNYQPKINEAMIIGSLTTMAAGVLSYYFGSSIGSREKQAQLNKMTDR